VLKCPMRFLHYFRNMSYYVWPSVLLWSIDRVFRLVRIFVFNFVCYKLDAQVDVLSSDFLRITLQRPGHTHWAPGQFAYLTVPGLSFLGSHPFTISSIDVPHLDGNNSSQLDLKQIKFLVRVHKRLTRCLRSAARDGEPIKVLFDGPYGASPQVTGFETVILIAGTSALQNQPRRSIHEI
jgi:ferric-chelate reductase